LAIVEDAKNATVDVRLSDERLDAVVVANVVRPVTTWLVVVELPMITLVKLASVATSDAKKPLVLVAFEVVTFVKLALVP
jgi:hypothetical protein